MSCEDLNAEVCRPHRLVNSLSTRADVVHSGFTSLVGSCGMGFNFINEVSSAYGTPSAREEAGYNRVSASCSRTSRNIAELMGHYARDNEQAECKQATGRVCGRIGPSLVLYLVLGQQPMQTVPSKQGGAYPGWGSTWLLRGPQGGGHGYSVVPDALGTARES
jgi:hypothetical protein